MDHQSKNHNQNGNSFLFGLILGGIITLIFATKKGREIVREVTDKALEKFSDIEDKLSEEEIIEGDDYVEPAEAERIKLASETKSEKSHPEKVDGSTAPKPHRAVKRFFRNRN